MLEAKNKTYILNKLYKTNDLNISRVTLASKNKKYIKAFINFYIFKPTFFFNIMTWRF